jgi:hypothetical protein
VKSKFDNTFILSLENNIRLDLKSFSNNLNLNLIKNEGLFCVFSVKIQTVVIGFPVEIEIKNFLDKFCH